MKEIIPISIHERVVKKLGDEYGYGLLRTFKTNAEEINKAENKINTWRAQHFTAAGLATLILASIGQAIDAKFITTVGLTGLIAVAGLMGQVGLTIVEVGLICCFNKNTLNDVELARQVLEDNGHKPRPRRIATRKKSFIPVPQPIPVKNK